MKLHLIKRGIIYYFTAAAPKDFKISDQLSFFNFLIYTTTEVKTGQLADGWMADYILVGQDFLQQLLPESNLTQAVQHVICQYKIHHASFGTKGRQLGNWHGGVTTLLCPESLTLEIKSHCVYKETSTHCGKMMKLKQILNLTTSKVTCKYAAKQINLRNIQNSEILVGWFIYYWMSLKMTKNN